MSVVARNSVLRKSFGISDTIDDADRFARVDQQHRYHLYDGRYSTKRKGPRGISGSIKSLNKSAQVKDQKARGCVRPHELSLIVGAALLTVMLLVTAILAVLQIMITKLNGAFTRVVML